MNLWLIVSTVILTLGLNASPLYHLPKISLLEDQVETKASIEGQRLERNEAKLPHKIDNDSMGVKISAQSAAILDWDSETVLWQKNAQEQRSIASITKLMTSLVFLEHNPGWKTEVVMVIGDEVGGVAPNIMRGERVRVEDLFYVSLIASDNNAINALVRSTGLSKEKFVDLMNQKAKDLGLENTQFVGVTGLNDGNKSTAIDVLKLAKVAFSNRHIKDAAKRSSYTFVDLNNKSHKAISTNRLLNSYLNVEAGKTGYITASGFCLVSQISGTDGQNIIGVVLGSESNDHRFQDLKILSAWVLENFIWS